MMWLNLTNIVRRLLIVVAVSVSTLALHASDTALVKHRLNDGVNSYQPVVYPVLSYDRQRLFFSRKFHPFNVGSTKDPDDIWFCERGAAGVWSEAINIGTPLNTPESNILCSISPNGATALLQTTIQLDGRTQQVYALAQATATGWSSPRVIHIRNFRNDSPNFYAHLAYDDSTLFLAIENSMSYGGLDLYVSFREGQSLNFSEPLNLGSSINTKGTEGSPCLAFDGQTLYFSSDGRGGFGNQDLFMTRRRDSTWRHWTEPENLGPSINTVGLDHCFSLSADGMSAFVVSADSDSRKGIFQIVLPPSLRMGKSVVVLTSLAERVDTLTFELHFESNKSDINESEWTALERQLRAADWSHNPTILIDGYADSTGDEEKNRILSKRRAENVSRRLHSEDGLQSASRHQLSWHGSSVARFDNSTEVGRRNNRSVSIRVIAAGEAR